MFNWLRNLLDDKEELLESQNEIESKENKILSVKEQFEQMNNVNQLKYYFSNFEYQLRKLPTSESEIHIPKMRSEYEKLLISYFNRETEVFIDEFIKRVKVSFGSVVKQPKTQPFADLINNFKKSLMSLNFKEIQENPDSQTEELKEDNFDLDETESDEIKDVGLTPVKTKLPEADKKENNPVEEIDSSIDFLFCEFCDQEVKKLGWKRHVNGKKHRDNAKE